MQAGRRPLIPVDVLRGVGSCSLHGRRSAYHNAAWPSPAVTGSRDAQDQGAPGGGRNGAEIAVSSRGGQPRFWLEAAKVGAAVAIPVCADLDRFDSGSLNEKGSVQPSWSPLNVL